MTDPATTTVSSEIPADTPHEQEYATPPTLDVKEGAATTTLSTTIIEKSQLEPKEPTPATTATEGPSTRRPHRSSRSRSRSRSGRSVSSVSSSRSNSKPSHQVIFSTAAKYDQWVVLALSIPLVLIAFQMVASLIATKVYDFERSGTVWLMGWTFILILGLYACILPKQVDIRSNGTIGIKTFLITYQFGDVCHAYLAGLGAATFVGKRHRFATCLDPSNQVVIRRREGQWDIVVSPENADEFLRTMQSLITKLEIQRGSAETSQNGDSAASSSGVPVESISLV